MKYYLIFVLFLFGLIFIGCDNKTEQASPGTSMSVDGKDSVPPNILMVIAPENFRDEELFETRKILEDNGMKVTVASTASDTAKGMLGGKTQPDLLISDANPDSYIAVLVVGGIGSMKYLWNNTDLKTLVQNAYKKNKVVGAICLSPVVLARAGLLKGIKATVFADEEAIKELKDNGAVYVDKKVVVAGRIVTARDPESIKDFASKVLGLIKNNK